MYGREELYRDKNECGTIVYNAAEADAVMDAMEARIKHLESILDLDPRTNLSLVDENQQLRSRIKELESQLPKWKALDDLAPKNKYLKFLSLKDDGKYKVNVGYVLESVFGLDVVVLRGTSVVSESFKDLKGKSFYLELTLPPLLTTEENK